MGDTLYLLDGMALAYRAHFAFINRPIFNSRGMNTSLLYGFTNTLLDLMEKQKPSHMALVMDTQAPTKRHEIYPEYKATRQEPPEDLTTALPRLDDIAAAFHMPVLRKDGWEADDIIGTLAHRASDAGMEVFMVTPDKDFGQLVRPAVKIYKPGYQGSEPEILGVGEVLKRWEIERVEQVIDMLALVGDSSDNIPGVPGIGPKTAVKLIKQFGTLENLLDNTAEIKGKLREKIEENADQARLSKTLATIDTETPLDVEWDFLKRKDPDRAELARLFQEFEFRTLGKRILGDDFALGAAAPASVQDTGEPEQMELLEETELKTLKDVEHTYHEIAADDAAGRKALIEKLSQRKSFCFDVETDGANPRNDGLLGLAFAWRKSEAYFVHCPRERAGAQALLEEFRAVLEDPEIEKVGHNLKFDITVLQAHGIAVGGPVFDTMLVNTLIEPEQKQGMDALARIYLGYKCIPISDLIGERGPNQKSLSTVKLSRLAEYSAEDADVTWQFVEILRPKLKEKQQERLYYEIEAPLVPVLAEMERIGITVDVPVLGDFSDKLTEVIERTGRQIEELVGHEFNLNSPKQLGEVLFEELKLLDKPKKTATGQYSTNEQVLRTLAAKHEVPRLILEYREVVKLKNTYVDTLPDAVDERTGRVHTSYGQLHTVTGRLASSGPNLQNIPIRTELGQEIRKAFVAQDDRHLLLSADYSQIELRIIAALSQDPGMLEAFEADKDIHSATAAKIYGVSEAEVTREQRSKAKMVNFGIPYGISGFGLAQRLDISRSEGNELINEYFNQFPRIRDYIETTLDFARKNGFVETLFGRRRYLRDINSRNWTTRGGAERNAINMPIQGTAADMIKIAMVNVANALKNRGMAGKLLLQVHDELVLEVPVAEKEEATKVVIDQMQKALELDCPIKVEAGAGHNWLEAH